MSAIDNKHLIEIVSVQESSGVSRKTGNPWKMYRAQCVVTGGDSGAKVGELLLPDSLKDTEPGKYLAEFQLDVSFERLVVPRITALHPHGAGANGRAQPKAGAGAAAAA